MSTNNSPSSFSISEEFHNLFSKYAGINNEFDLREHIINIHQKAIAARPYRCIREFRFINLRAKEHPFYATAVSDFLMQAKVTQRPPQLCDLGCAMGTDLRQFVLDGVPASSATGIDISEELISIGFELFREERGSPRHPINWVVGNVLSDDAGINVISGGNGDGDAHPKNKDLLSHYHEYFDLIYNGAVIHLFPQDTVKKFLSHAIQMLRPHGTIFGRNIGARDYPFVVNYQVRQPKPGLSLGYLHTKESIKQLLEELGLVKVESWVFENKNNTDGVEVSEQRKQMVLLCWKGVKPGLSHL